jgi:hypothetical protein
VAKVGALIAAVLVVSGGAGCGGSGSTSPRDELSKFVVDYVDNNRGGCCELGMHVKVDHIRFAPSNPRWAAVSMAVTAANGSPDGTDYLVARKIGSHWTVVGFGKGTIGCHVPVALRTALAVGLPDGLLDCSTAG